MKIERICMSILQGLSLELATLGDLKLMERPATFTVGPRDFVNATASIKVASTDTGIIFGTIVYDIRYGVEVKSFPITAK
jgi:coatomer subunit beta